MHPSETNHFKIMSTEKKRLDILIVEQGLFDSRKEAQTAIMDGWVLVNDERVTKPGANINTTSSIKLRSGFKKKRFVSRGGLKLEKALHEFAIDVKERVCIDLGASTGGFTDCLLKQGAKRVYAVDVGYGQIDWSLRQDDRVVLKERQNARYLTKELLYQEDNEFANFACIDCSFISLSKIIPVLPKILISKSFEAVCLIKPQFEAGKDQTNKGIVKDPKVHKQVIEKMKDYAIQSNLVIANMTYSPIKGPKGNIEYLAHLKNQGEEGTGFEKVVEGAFSNLQ